MEKFEQLYQRACQRKGGEVCLSKLLSCALSAEEVENIRDDRFLAAFTQTIFQSGFVWSVVRNKWPGFEEAFFGFAPEKMVLLNDQHIEKLCQDTRIVRARQKIVTVPQNAQMILELAREHGSFANFVAHWPSNDVTGLWLYLKQHGARLGGNIAAYSLRKLGVDTFILTKDVEGYLRSQGALDVGTTSKKGLQQCQQAFNELQQQSGLSYTQLSQIIANSVGDNYQ
ncbi:DNA-3-methyladenine glycosylase I [Motilimonas sp. 1_MG-2023]|uniref:DNA-3-methyladenine glycosylase I n=2 Tax=unclassified Motilimonas TaxID=2643697 RepID=UPI0026E30DDE|nr:DNA-3-methyladenine glycosylase I [Motilimonas sp. 1_MG-2023]MDO6525882.1 DNA-3-methyladenine glycosylase I [Motilimonas sp. 1_MG-2023]